MNTLLLDSSLLIHEFQLGEKLSECVHNDRRADFSLMLAMLCEDVRSHSQFTTPENSERSSTKSELSLRKALQVGDEEKLAMVSLDEIPLFNQSPINEEELLDIKFENILAPKALAFRDDKTFLHSQLVNNTSAHCQKRISSKQGLLGHKLEFNTNGWLDNVRSSIDFQQ